MHGRAPIRNTHPVILTILVDLTLIVSSGKKLRFYWKNPELLLKRVKVSCLAETAANLFSSEVILASAELVAGSGMAESL